jgi:hypothetical protein
MAISRRTLFRHLGAGTAAAIGFPPVARAADLAHAFGRSADRVVSGGPVRLHRNENPFGPSPRVLAAIRDTASQSAGRYPDDAGASLRKTLANLHHVYADQVVLGAASGAVDRARAGLGAPPNARTCELSIAARDQSIRSASCSF